jgi:hypothetical protein
MDALVLEAAGAWRLGRPLLTMAVVAENLQVTDSGVGPDAELYHPHHCS